MQYPKSMKYIQNELDAAKVPQQCIHCGTCRTWYQSKNWDKVCPSGEWKGFDPYYLSGKMQLVMGLLNGRVKWSKEIANPFFECTLCGNCSEQCYIVETNGDRPIFRLALPMLEAVRAEAVAHGLNPEAQKKFGEYISAKHNPYNEEHKARTSWLKEAVGKTQLSKNPDFVYFVGCTASYRQKNIAIATVKAFKKLGLNFVVMEDEYCCGSPLLRTGQWEKVKELAKHNIEEVKKTGAKTIVTACPGCYKVWALDYSKDHYGKMLGVEHNFKVQHASQLLADMLKQKKLKFSKPVNAKVTYHDPCHMGRNFGSEGVYDQPRDVLKAMPGLKLVEMDRNRNAAWCCGSGGGVKSAFSDFALWTGVERVKEAAKTNATVLASACPFCQRNLNDAATAKGTKMEVVDLMELVERAL
jgi:heterodisulfide reductase subunit D